jgi:hypothetical protein
MHSELYLTKGNVLGAGWSSIIFRRLPPPLLAARPGLKADFDLFFDNFLRPLEES